MSDDQMIGLYVVLGATVVAFGLCAFCLGRLRRAQAADAVDRAIHPYRLADLDAGATLAAGLITERFGRRGRRGYAAAVLDLLAWIAAGAVATSAVFWWQDLGIDRYAPVGWMPYAPAAAVVTGFALMLAQLVRAPERRARTMLGRLARGLLPLSSRGFLDPDCATEFDILGKAILVRSRATQQSARDQVAELAHALLPQIRQMDDDQLRRTIGSAVAFVPRQSGQGLDTDRFAELLALFDALFGRLRDDTGHQDIWRIAILRQLIRYTGPNVLPEIFGDFRVRPGSVSVEGLSVSRAADGSVLDTAFGRGGSGASGTGGLGLIVDLTQGQPERASNPDEWPSGR
ncbi:hypothetical protein [Kineosporia succinea]|uniref:Phage abortive infection protein n=1 Tax=Kineosporia succinea TaxID=84632 RepID=A0ABT9P4J2_9ACTN|nr:hypothetical protein [Kineosporia succinea]MDP9827618.1 hypothetical protein [Kineosporia succinea]